MDFAIIVDESLKSLIVKFDEIIDTKNLLKLDVKLFYNMSKVDFYISYNNQCKDYQD